MLSHVDFQPCDCNTHSNFDNDVKVNNLPGKQTSMFTGICLSLRPRPIGTCPSIWEKGCRQQGATEGSEQGRHTWARKPTAPRPGLRASGHLQGKGTCGWSNAGSPGSRRALHRPKLPHPSISMSNFPGGSLAHSSWLLCRLVSTKEDSLIWGESSHLSGSNKPMRARF